MRETIARLGKTRDIRVSDPYHRLRVRELELTADYLTKAEEERERIRAERERRREEERAQREFEREKTRLSKEQGHYAGALGKLIAKGDETGAAELCAKLLECVPQSRPAVAPDIPGSKRDQLAVEVAAKRRNSLGSAIVALCALCNSTYSTSFGSFTVSPLTETAMVRDALPDANVSVPLAATKSLGALPDPLPVLQCTVTGTLDMWLRVTRKLPVWVPELPPFVVLSATRVDGFEGGVVATVCPPLKSPELGP